MAKKQPDFRIELVGDIKPDTVPLSALARVMAAVQRIAIGDVLLSDDDEPTDAVIEAVGKGFRLIDVRSGSAVYRLAADNVSDARKNVALMGRLIESDEPSAIATSAIGALEDLSAVAKALGCKILIRGSADKSGDVLARIEPETYPRVAGRLFVEGETSIEGNVSRVGGATALHCHLRLPNRHRLLICRVTSREVARHLGQSLYQDVVVHGTAKWLRHNWRLSSFVIRDMDKPEAGDIDKALDAIWAAGGNAWDKIKNPDKFLEETTGAR